MGANDFRVYVDAVIKNIDESALRKWENRQKTSGIKMPVILDMSKLPSALNEAKKRIDVIKSAMGSVKEVWGQDEKGVQVLKQATLQYRTQAGLVTETLNKIGQTDKYTSKMKITTDGVLASERFITAEAKKQNDLKQKQAKIQDSILEKTTKQLNTFKAKSFQPSDKLDSANAIAMQMEQLMARASNMRVGGAPRTKATEQLKLLSEELRVAQIGLKQTGAEAMTFGEKLSATAQRMAVYTLATQLAYKAMQQLREGIQYIIELNKEMTDIQIVTGFDSGKIDALSHSYNQMAKELGATTLEVAKGSLAWFRQGKTIEEAAQLTEASIKMSKLANMDSAQSTEYLTSMINGFKLESEDVMGVIDKLVAVDNTAATSVEELASAMQRSSNVAQQSGVSFNELVAYIGTVSSVTRRSATTIGEAFKTMLTRMADIQNGNLDETGMSINNVEKSLRGVGIELRDSDTSFRDFSDVIRDVAKKWDTLNEVEQANIAKAIAGVRQRETFLVLMENYNNVTDDRVSVEKLLETQLNATGLANERYKIYLDNLEAAQNKSRAAWEELWEATIKSDAIKWFYDFSAALMENITAMGGLIPIVTTLAGAFLMFKSTGWIASLAQAGVVLPTFASGISGITVALKGLSIASVAALPPLTLIIGALTLATAAWFSYNQNITKNVEKGKQDVFNAVDAKIQKLKSEKATVEEVMDAYNQSIKATQGDEFGKAFLGNDLKEIRLDILRDYLKLLEETSMSQEEYAKATKEAVEATGMFVDETGRVYKEVATSHGIRRQYIDDIYILTDAMRKAYASVDPDERSLELISEEELESIREAGDGFKDFYKGIGSAVQELNNQFADLDELMKKSVEGTLEFSDIEKLPQEYADALIIENGQIKLNINLLKEEQIIMAQLAVDKVEAAYRNQEATIDEVNLMKMKLQMLKDDAAQTHGVFEQTAWNYQNLMWQIANQASAAGEQVFFDLQGNALNSAQAIFDFMSQSDQNFMNLVQQYANAVGISVADAMQMIGGYVNAVYNDGVNKINTLLNYAGYGNGLSYATGDLQYQNQGSSSPSLPSATPLPSFPSGGIGGGNRGGGGGGSSSKEDKEEERRRQIEDDIEAERRRAIDNLKNQLDLYKDIIDARKELLDTLADEREYQQDVEDKQADILKIQNELAALQFDNSAEGEARRLELEAQLAEEEKELEDIQFDQSIERQQAALDAQYEAFAERINAAIQSIENIEAGSVSDFASQLSVILSSLESSQSGSSISKQTLMPKFHDGAERGLVGGGGSKSGEVMAKLMSGELVSNESQMDNFIKKTLPSLVGVNTSPASSGVNFEKLFDLVVQGNLDSSVMADLEKMSQKITENINKSLFSRGIARNTNLTRI